MSDKYLKEIAKELKLIRKELQESNKPVDTNIEKLAHELEEKANMREGTVRE